MPTSPSRLRPLLAGAVVALLAACTAGADRGARTDSAAPAGALAAAAPGGATAASAAAGGGGPHGGGAHGGAPSAAAAATSIPEGTPDATRVVSIGGGVTETIYALGGGERIVAIDLTSSGYPPQVARLPQVGQLHSLSAEGILAQRPTLVVANAEAGPPPVLEQVRVAGVPVARIRPARSEAQAYQLYRDVARALGRPAAGDSLARRVEGELARVRAAIPAGTRPRVLFLYARGPRLLLVFGRESAGDEMLRLAGAENSAAGIVGAKPLSPEAVVGAAPDVILVPSRGLESIGGVDGVLALPGLAETPAGRARRVVPIDDSLILGFGPRLPEAVRALAKAVRP